MKSVLLLLIKYQIWKFSYSFIFYQLDEMSVFSYSIFLTLRQYIGSFWPRVTKKPAKILKTMLGAFIGFNQLLLAKTTNF